MSAGSGKYLLVISIHGLIRGHDLELGRDADTGGQTKYVVDLVAALAEQPEVERIDLVTRRIVDAAVSEDYSLPDATSVNGCWRAACHAKRSSKPTTSPAASMPRRRCWPTLRW